MEITSKSGLIKNLRSYYSSSDVAISNSYQIHDSIPTTFILSGQTEDLELQNFICRFNEIASLKSNKEKTPTKHCERNVWLLKPANWNQGKGIEILSNLKAIMKSLREKPAGSKWVIQKYIERPLLINNRKFDIRVWVLITGRKDLFFYKQGYIRTSSFEYNLQEKANYVHLTNNCLQQFSDKYGEYEEGNTLSFEQLESYLNSKSLRKFSLDADLIPRMKDLVIDSFMSCRKSFHKVKNLGNFELVGFDFLVDEDFRVWLLEINTNPYLGVPNEFIRKLLPVMLDDLLALTVDTVFETKYKRTDENGFELIYCENNSLFSSKAVNKRRSFGISVYPSAEFEQLPLCKACVAVRTDFDSLGKSLIDFLQIGRHMMQTEITVQAEDLNEFFRKLMKYLDFWKRYSEEQIINCLEAFTFLYSSRSVFNSQKSHLRIVITYLCDPDISITIKSLTLQTIQCLFKQVAIKKYLVNINLIPALVSILLTSSNNLFINTSKNLLINLCENPSNHIYFTAKLNEYRSIREIILHQGGLVALVLFYQSSQSFHKLTSFISHYFSIDELQKQEQIIQENMQKPHEFPHLLLSRNLESASQIFSKILRDKFAESQNKINQNKKEKEEQERKSIELEILQKQLEEDKRQKIKKYLKKKITQITKEKKQKEKHERLEKEFEEKLRMQRKSIIIQKSQKSMEKSLRLKRSNSENKALRKLEQAREEINERHSKKFKKEWMKFKGAIEKSVLKVSTKDRSKSKLSIMFDKLNKIKSCSHLDQLDKEASFGITQKIIRESIKFPFPAIPREQGSKIELSSKHK